MKQLSKTENRLITALHSYLELQKEIELSGEELRESRLELAHAQRSLNHSVMDAAASVIAGFFDCQWYWTNQGNISFADNLSDVANTRRDDALSFFRRHVLMRGQIVKNQVSR